MRHAQSRGVVATAAITTALLVATATMATAHPDSGGVTDDPSEVHEDEELHLLEHDFDNDGPLLGLDEFDVISGAPYAKVTKNLSVAGRGERLEANVTTDVWAHNGYAYTGTFSSDCSDGTAEDESGIWIWDVHNPNKPEKVGVLISPAGSKANDVKVFTNTAGDDILVFTNESCAGGPGGVEIYQVNDPADPAYLGRLQVDDANSAARVSGLYYGTGLTDSGIHNQFLWSRDGRDYLGVSAELAYGNFQIFDITDPSAPTFVSSFGPEDVEFAAELAALGIDSFGDGDLDVWTDDFNFDGPGTDLWFDANAWIFDGFGASANRVMHDLFVNEDGSKAYVNFWDGGMILLDITDPYNPEYISTALDPTSTDGEVNSHSVWTEDDVVVVEGEEDFAPYATEGLNITTGPDAGNYQAFELGFTSPIAQLPTKEMAGPTVYVGRACDIDQPFPEATADDQIALVLRGACRFDEKTLNVQQAGYAGIVVFTASPGDAPFSGGGDTVVEGVPITIPGVMVGNTTGLLLGGGGAIGDAGESVAVTAVWNGWSGLRIWDYSDPENPVLASTFDTACSALEPGSEGAEECVVGGTYSSHNLVIEDGIAYISWYTDGMLMVDVSDPYNPVEVGRYHESGPAFEETNGGPQDIWGVYKEENSPWVYASDRNGGLYVLKAYGSGSGKNGKAQRDEG